MNVKFTAIAIVGLASCVAAQENVLVLSSGSVFLDDAVVAAIEGRGHTATIGADYATFDGSGIQSYSVVYVQANNNWFLGDMSAQGQASLIDYVCKGGGIVTSEWVTWKVGAGFMQAVGTVFPMAVTTQYTTTSTATYTQDVADPVINAGLPAAFTFPLDSFSGTESIVQPKPGATSYYTTNQFSGTASGVVAWDYASGRVAAISTTCGVTQVADPNFSVLLGNLMTWAGGLSPGGSLPCTADCDKSGALDFFDFLCFQNQFSTGNTAADCDCNQTLDFFDFLCFQNLFSAGC